MLPLFDNDNDYQYLLKTGDVLAMLATIPDQSIDLVVTSPPYGIGKPYERRVDLQEYLDYQRGVINTLRRVMRPTGSICWQVGNYVDAGEIFPLDTLFYPIFKTAGMKLRNRIVWHYRHGLHASKRFSGRYETLQWFTMGDEYTFNLDSVRVPALYPGKRHFRGKKRGQISGNLLGKNPSDVWDILDADWQNGFWDIPNVKHNHPEKTPHPAQFPIEIPERCVLSMSNPGDTVLDPYAGAGATVIAAIMHQRQAIGIDREPDYIAIIEQRVQMLKNGTLPYRPIGTPIHKPPTTPTRSNGGELSPPLLDGY